MGFISISDVPKTNIILQQLSIKFGNYGFAADELIPIVDVGEDNEQGNYFLFAKENLNSNIDDTRALTNRSNTPLRFTTTVQSYSGIEHSLELPIDNREFKQNKNKALNLGKSTMEYLIGLLLIAKEKRAATLIETSGNYDATHVKDLSASPNNQWDDFINGDIEGDVEIARELVALEGFEPNKISIPIQVWRKIRQSPQIRALIKNQDSRLLTDELIPPSLWGLKLVVPGSRQVSSLIGSTETLARLWGKNVFIGFVNDKPEPIKQDPSFAYNFQAKGRDIQTYEERANKSEVVNATLDISDSKITSACSGYLLQNVIS
jgi:hypothetical protein